MPMTDAAWVGLLLVVMLGLGTAAQAQSSQANCLQRCSATLGCGDGAVCASIYDNCMNSCRNGSGAAAPDGWIVLVLSEPDFAAGIAHGFTSKDAAIQEALTVCRRNGGADCKVVWSDVNTCMGFVDSLNKRPWIWSAAGGGSRSQAVANALLECRKRGGDNCLVRNTPCSDDDARFPSPFEAASRAAIVDPKTVGTWELPVGNGRWVWQIDPRGTYQFHSETGDGAKHFGSFASNGKVWELHTSTGDIDGGSYTIQAPDLFIATGKLGTGNWRRVSSAP